MTEVQEAEAGRMIAEILLLRHDLDDPHRWRTRDLDDPHRWRTTWGSKTDLGLFRSVARMVDEARAGKELKLR